MGLRDVYVFEDRSGRLVFAKSYGSLRGDEDLISGFLSSIQNFLAEVAEDEIREISGRRFRFLFKKAGDCVVCVVVDGSEDSKSSKRLLDSVTKAFMKASRGSGLRRLDQFEKKCDEIAESWGKLVRWSEALDQLDEWG